MQPTIETEDYVEFVQTGTTYRIPKTNPPTMVVTYDMGARKGMTSWQEVVAAFADLV